MRLIDADELIETKAYWHGKLPDVGCLYPDGVEAVDVDDIENAPTVDAVLVTHGCWINIPPYYASNGNYNKAQECSVCHAFYVSPGNTPYSNHNYCADCGAKMDGDIKWRESI